MACAYPLVPHYQPWVLTSKYFFSKQQAADSQAASTSISKDIYKQYDVKIASGYMKCDVKPAAQQWWWKSNHTNTIQHIIDWTNIYFVTALLFYRVGLLCTWAMFSLCYSAASRVFGCVDYSEGDFFSLKKKSRQESNGGRLAIAV